MDADRHGQEHYQVPVSALICVNLRFLSSPPARGAHSAEAKPNDASQARSRPHLPPAESVQCVPALSRLTPARHGAERLATYVLNGRIFVDTRAESDYREKHLQRWENAIRDGGAAPAFACSKTVRKTNS